MGFVSCTNLRTGTLPPKTTPETHREASRRVAGDTVGGVPVLPPPDRHPMPFPTRETGRKQKGSTDTQRPEVADLRSGRLAMTERRSACPMGKRGPDRLTLSDAEAGLANHPSPSLEKINRILASLREVLVR